MPREPALLWAASKLAGEKEKEASINVRIHLPQYTERRQLVLHAQKGGDFVSTFSTCAGRSLKCDLGRGPSAENSIVATVLRTEGTFNTMAKIWGHA